MNKIYRSRSEKKIAGICGGLGELLNIDPTLIRLAVIFLCVATAFMPLVLTYLIGWIIIPLKPAEGFKQVS